MPRFYVATRPSSSGEHAVHATEADCDRHAEPEARLDLGYHRDCNSAANEARETFVRVTRCSCCSSDSRS